MKKKVVQIHLTKVPSTNTWAKENYKNFDLSQITRITADEQTKGRGRFNRVWVSPKGVNIYLTFFFAVEKSRLALNNLPQILSISIANLLDKEGLKPQIKWPNDVLINRKKLAGILCETIDLGNSYGVILGTGINVNMSQDMLRDIDQAATSLLVETGKLHSKEFLTQSLETLFLKDLFLYQKEGFNPFYKTYDDLIAFKGEVITFHQNGESFSGTLHSLNPDGRLNLLLSSGEIKALSSGEIENRV